MADLKAARRAALEEMRELCLTISLAYRPQKDTQVERRETALMSAAAKECVLHIQKVLDKEDG